MSTPLTSPRPDMPAPTSPIVPLRSWFTKIGDWIAGLSPAGATAYDTDWVNDPAKFTVGTGWGSPIFRYRRIGKWAYIYVQVTATATHTRSATLGNITDPTLGTINDATLRPAGPDIGYGLSGGNSRATSASIILTGAVSVQTVAGTANILAGDNMRAYGMFPLT